MKSPSPFSHLRGHRQAQGWHPSRPCQCPTPGNELAPAASLCDMEAVHTKQGAEMTKPQALLSPKPNLVMAVVRALLSNGKYSLCSQ